MGPRNQVTVLLVDDDQPEVSAIERGLAAQGIRVLHAPNKRVGLQRFYADRPDAMVINPTAPGMPPLQLLERVRTLSDLPVVMIPPPTTPAEVISAFRAGADDLVAKPVDPEELAMRLQAVLRRASTARAAGSGYADRHLELDFDALEARATGGARVELTQLQFRLLSSLVKNRNSVLTSHQLLELVWGPRATSAERVKVQVSNLRDRLARAGLPKDLVQTVTGVGYRYRPR
jgi:DNA-binding response OmpR family regulator